MTSLPPKDTELGQIPLAELAAMSGLSFFEKVLAGELPLPTICGTVPMRLREITFGRVLWETCPTPGVLNPMGGVHGGYAMTVLDTALGCAVHSTLDAGRVYTTLEVKANLTRAIKPDASQLFAEGKVIQAGRRIATAEARLTDTEGTIYAFGTTTCLIMDYA